MSDDDLIGIRINTDNIRFKKDGSHIRYPFYAITGILRISHNPFLCGRIIPIKSKVFCFTVEIFLAGCKFVNDNIDSTACPVVIFIAGIKNVFMSTDGKADNIRTKIATKRNNRKKDARILMSINWADIIFHA